MKTTKGSALKIMSTMLGVALMLLALYYLMNNKIVYGSITGFAGILIIALSLMITQK